MTRDHKLRNLTWGIEDFARRAAIQDAELRAAKIRCVAAVASFALAFAAILLVLI